MVEDRNGNSILRFGLYEVDPRSGELRKRGLRIKLQEQPFKVLIALLEHPGEVVTREELRTRIWPSESFGDFDHAVNVAVAKLRNALNDSADVPRFVETLHRRGYRFVGSVVLDRSREAGPADIQPLTSFARASSRRMVTLISLAAVLVLLAATVWRTLDFRERVRPMKQRILTASSIENGAESPLISPDGKYLAYSEKKGLFLLRIDSGDVRQISEDGNQLVAGWFPDGEKLLLQKDREDGLSDFYSFSFTSGVRRKLLDAVYATSLSHDGSTIAFTKPPGEVWLVNSDGENPRKIAQLDSGNAFPALVWAPGDNQLVLLHRYVHTTSEDVMLETRDLKGRLSATLVTDRRLQATGEFGFCWSQDGRVFYSLLEDGPNRSSIWSLAVNPQTGRPSGKPVLIQDFNGFVAMDLSASADGRRLTYSITRSAPALYFGELKSGSTRLESVQPALTDSWGKTPTAWSLDSKSIYFESDRKGRSGLYKISIADRSVEEILTGTDDYVGLRVSPDGKWLLFWAVGNSTRLLRQPVQGGALETVLTAKRDSLFRCSSVGDRCILMESTVLENGQLENLFVKFDPVTGKTKEITRVVVPPSGGREFAVSHDGKTIAFVFNTNEIQFISTEGGAVRRFSLPGQRHLQTISWSTDSKKVFASVLQGEEGKQLIAVDLNGQAIPMLQNRKAWYIWSPLASPDGRYLAWVETTSETNVGMLENF